MIVNAKIIIIVIVFTSLIICEFWGKLFHLLEILFHNQ